MLLLELENKAAQLVANDKRPFTDGEFVKKRIMTVVKTVCLGETKLFLFVSFSARTITRRIVEMSENVKCNQKDYFKDLQFSQ